MTYPQSVDPITLGASQLLDLTDAINAVRDGVQRINFTESCCSYEYQLLDKFCATRTEVCLYMYVHVCM